LRASGLNRCDYSGARRPTLLFWTKIEVVVRKEAGMKNTERKTMDKQREELSELIRSCSELAIKPALRKVRTYAARQRIIVDGEKLRVAAAEFIIKKAAELSSPHAETYQPLEKKGLSPT